MTPSTYHVKLAYEHAAADEEAAVDCLLTELEDLGATVVSRTTRTDWFEVSVAIDAYDPVSALVAVAGPVTAALARCGVAGARLVEVGAEVHPSVRLD